MRRSTRCASPEFLFDVPAPRPLTALLAYERQARLFVRGDGVTRKTRARRGGLPGDARPAAADSASAVSTGARPTLADFDSSARCSATSAWIRRRAASCASAPRRSTSGWPGCERQAPAARPCSDDPQDPAAPGQLPSGWGPLLDDIGQAYLPYLHHNASAFAARQRRFALSIQGVTYKDLPTVQYRVYCRHELQRRFHELPAASRAQVEQTLARHGCLEPPSCGAASSPRC